MSSFNFGSRPPSSSSSSSTDDSMVIDPSLTTGIPTSSTQTVSASATVFRPDPQASLFIDTLAQRFHLTKQQTSDLHGLFQVHFFYLQSDCLSHSFGGSWRFLLQAVLIKQILWPGFIHWLASTDQSSVFFMRLRHRKDLQMVLEICAHSFRSSQSASRIHSTWQKNRRYNSYLDLWFMAYKIYRCRFDDSAKSWSTSTRERHSNVCILMSK